MIPTIGRVVHVHCRPGSIAPSQPEVALVCSVNTTGLTVAGFDANGDPFKSQVPFHEDPKKPRPTVLHACWPPLA